MKGGKQASKKQKIRKIDAINGMKGGKQASKKQKTCKIDAKALPEK